MFSHRAVVLCLHLPAPAIAHTSFFFVLMAAHGADFCARSCLLFAAPAVARTVIQFVFVTAHCACHSFLHHIVFQLLNKLIINLVPAQRISGTA